MSKTVKDCGGIKIPAILPKPKKTTTTKKKKTK